MTKRDILKLHKQGKLIGSYVYGRWLKVDLDNDELPWFFVQVKDVRDFEYNFITTTKEQLVYPKEIKKIYSNDLSIIRLLK